MDTCFVCKKTGPDYSMNFCWVWYPGSDDEHNTDINICTDCLEPDNDEDGEW